MVRTLLISRAAAMTSDSVSSTARKCGWKQARLLKVAERIAIGGASTGRCWNWCLSPSCNSSLSVSWALNWASSILLGRRPKINSHATSTKFGFCVNCSMGIPR